MDLFRVLMVVRSKLRQKKISDYGPLQSISKCKPYFRHCHSHPDKTLWEGDIATTRPTQPRGAELVKKLLYIPHWEKYPNLRI